MAGRYAALTDEDLAAKITTFSDALESIALGGEVARIQSDGRLMELVRGNTGGAEAILDLLLLEQEKRANGGRLPGRALGMRFGR
jgi:hypothetical protein